MLTIFAGLTAGLLYGVAAWWQSREVYSRVFRIGVNNSPPLNMINPDGSFGGIAVEMLKEAAKRSGIKLQWVAATGDVEASLRTGFVDLWPLLTDTPERRERVYLTDPWLENSFVLMVREEDSLLSPREFNGKRVSALKLAINERLLRRFLPGVQLVRAETTGAEIQALCRGEVRAAFLDTRSGMSQLLRRAHGCEETRFGIVPVEGAKFGLGVAATRRIPAAAVAARILRGEITRLASDGTMSSIYARWLLSTAADIRTITDLRDSQMRNAVLGWFLGGLTIALGFAVSQVFRVRAARKGMEVALEAAECANAAKSEFLSNMSHELRTPMNGVIGMTELVLSSNLSDDQRSCLETVRDSGDALLRVINDVLDFSKIEAGCLDLESSDFEIRTVLENSIRMSAVRASQKGLKLRCDIGPNVPGSFTGDENRLRQVLLNLIGNALKFTESGEVVLSVAVEKKDCDGGLCPLHFSVRDTGIGIETSKQGIIFEAFTQGDGSTKRRFGGTGLGLAISSQLVQLFRGRIWVESKPGAGSTFHFTASFKLAAVERESEADWVSGQKNYPLPIRVVGGVLADRIPIELLRPNASPSLEGQKNWTQVTLVNRRR